MFDGEEEIDHFIGNFAFGIAKAPGDVRDEFEGVRVVRFGPDSEGAAQG